MNWLQRLLASLGAALLAELVVACFLTLLQRSTMNDFLGATIGFSLLVIPAWVLALPLVLSINRADGWRKWLLGTIGVGLGPWIILMIPLSNWIRNGMFPVDGSTLYMGAMATAIASVATGLYLLLVLRYPSQTPRSLSHYRPSERGADIPGRSACP